MARFPMPQDETKRREVMAIYREMGIEDGKVFSNFFTGMGDKSGNAFPGVDPTQMG